MTHLSRHRGFTLIEALIAVTVVTLAVAGPLYAASRALVAAEIARDEFTASYLAQEGIEYVRMTRDNAYLNNPSSGWSSFIASIEANCKTQACTVDPNNASLTVGYGSLGSSYSIVPFSGSAPPLYLTNCTNGSNGLSCPSSPNYYTEQNLSGSVQTAFTRTIQASRITSDASGNSIEEGIVATVTWSFHGTPYTVTVVDHLTPWQ